MRHRLPVLIALLLTSLVSQCAAAAPARPVPQSSRVLLVSVDGLRPDLALRANAPVIRSLMARGSYSLWARTTDIAITLPSHVSMLTGVPPSSHGVTWNSIVRGTPIIYPKWPTLFEVARNAGYTTAMVSGKSKFLGLTPPATLTWSFVPEATVISDSAVTDKAVEWIRGLAPQVLFVHLPAVDTAGHASGWGSPDQVAAIENADRCVGRLLDALAARGILDSTFLLITADHGGAGKSHGPNDPRSRMIPWIVAGPGVRAGFDLTLEDRLTIRTEDTFATLCYVLGLTPPRPIEGHVVQQAFTATRERQVRR